MQPEEKGRDVVIIKLMGGLASQLHKYAIGRTIADRYGCELKLDLSWYLMHNNEDTRREFLLGCYKARFDIASKAEIAKLKTGQLMSKVTRLGRRVGLPISATRRTHYVRGQTNLDVMGCRPPVYIEGEWFGGRYLEEDAGRLREDFCLKEALRGPAAEVLQRIQSGQSAAVHVRRGDFVHEPSASKFHYVLGMGYYKQAFDILRSRIPAIKFYVFSDDYDWVRTNFRDLGGGLTFVPEHAPHEDMFLMSSCKHQIIANSGFSWFGAWLNGNPGKMMFAPSTWVRDEGLNEEIVNDLAGQGFEIIDGND